MSTILAVERQLLNETPSVCPEAAPSAGSSELLLEGCDFPETAPPLSRLGDCSQTVSPGNSHMDGIRKNRGLGSRGLVTVAGPSPSGLITAPQARWACSCLRAPLPASVSTWLTLPPRSPQTASSSSHLCSNVTFSLSPTSTILSILADQPPLHTLSVSLPPSALLPSFSSGTRKPESHQNHREGLLKHRLLGPSLASSQVVPILSVQGPRFENHWANMPHTLLATRLDGLVWESDSPGSKYQVHHC